MAIVREPGGARLVAFLNPQDGPPPNVPLTGCFAVIRSNGRLLLVRNTDRPGWEMPGGAREPGEDPEACVRREIFEESGQTPAGLVLRGWAIWFAPQMGTGRSECSAVYAGTVDREAPFRPTDEIEAAEWFAPGREPEDRPAVDRVVGEIAERAG